MSVSKKKELFDYFDNFETRHQYVNSTIRQYLSMKIRGMRDARELEQEQLGELCGGMKQSAISRLEDPRYANITLKTLKRLAKGFDVALLVDLVPFSELVERVTERTEADFTPPKYADEKQLHPFEESGLEHV